MQISGQLSPEDFWARVDEVDRELRASFPHWSVYGLSQWNGSSTVGEWDHRGSTRVIGYSRWGGAKGAYPSSEALPFDLQVHTREGDSRVVVEALRRRSASLEERSYAWYRPVGDDDALPDRIVDIVVDGRLEPFEVWIRGRFWWAATSIGDRTIVVEAADVVLEEVALDRIDDVETLIEMRHEWMRRMRDEA